MKSNGNALIVGGGQIGYFLARELVRGGYRVNLVERDPVRAQQIADELGVVGYSGDGTDIACLSAAGARDADFLIAVTDKDEDNLVACQIAKRQFGTGVTIARVSDPQNEVLFERLGVDKTISTTGLAIRLVANTLPINGMRLLSAIGDSSAEIIEFALEPESSACGIAVSALALPPACVLIALIRDEAILFPRGDTVLRSGDRVFSLAEAATVPALSAVLIGGSAVA